MRTTVSVCQGSSGATCLALPEDQGRLQFAVNP
jgi:hypothetical protein